MHNLTRTEALSTLATLVNTPKATLAQWLDDARPPFGTVAFRTRWGTMAAIRRTGFERYSIVPR